MTVTFDRAKTLLTDTSPCYTLEDVERIFGVTFTPEQRIALETIPFSEDALRACAATHMLFPGFGLSLLDIREKCSQLFYAKTGGWYAKKQEAFSRATVPVQWHLFRVEPMPDSFSKTWGEQRRQLLLSEEEVQSSALVAYATMLHYGATKKRLFEDCCVRTSDVNARGRRVNVSNFDTLGCEVIGGWVDISDDLLGVASARKSS